MKNKPILLVLLWLSSLTGIAQALTPVPEKIPCVIPDRQAFQTPDAVQLDGWLGSRIWASESNRLAQLDPDRLLEGYRHRPGRQAWDGEHVGKWLHAATLAWVFSGDPELRRKLDLVAAELVKCQLPDGYLGTYVAKDYWTSWDVWAHKYNLLGLITYMRYTGNLAPLPACRRMGDLLCETFGDTPAKRDIIVAGEHNGLAPTSVLEPMALLYRLTGEPRYLDFCHYILRAWEQPNGPKIVSTLLSQQGVTKVGDAKAYEMLSCLNGALELYRTTGETNLLTASLDAWQDIVAHRLYVTGAASYCEVFHDDFDLPNNNNVGETCVTVTWLQFNAQLLRLTGEARFAEQLEHVVLNQLFGAQQPDGKAWGYYVQMEGKKPYSAALDGHCCLSSGPRGIALIPTFAFTTDADGAVVNLFETGSAQLHLRDGTPLTLKLATQFPASGEVTIRVEPDQPREFSLKLRIPAWCNTYSLHPNYPKKIGRDGYLVVHRQWKSGDTVELKLKLEPRVLVGDHLNEGKVAVLYGPLVLAADEALLANDGQPSLNALALAKPGAAPFIVTPENAPPDRRTWPGAQCFRVASVTPNNTVSTARLVPFADAGITGARYKVWLPIAGNSSHNAALDGRESRSRPGNLSGSINDGDPASFVVTYDSTKAGEDWFAVTLPAPVKIKRIVFIHGKNFHDGGWFDTSAGKPRIQIQRTPEGAWETIGELSDYPETTAAKGDDARLTWANKQFTFRLPVPTSVVAARVIGRPASGDNPAQAFVSCSELELLTQ